MKILQDSVSTRYFLFVDTVSTQYFLFVDTVSTRYFLFIDTVSMNRHLLNKMVENEIQARWLCVSVRRV